MENYASLILEYVIAKAFEQVKEIFGNVCPPLVDVGK